MKLQHYIDLLIASLIPPTILQKGKLSVTLNEVAILAYSPLKIHATVKSQSGYWDYNILFTKKNEIEDFTITCDCPVKDKYCKHIAATVLYLKKNQHQIVLQSPGDAQEEAVITFEFEYTIALNELMIKPLRDAYTYYDNANKFTDIAFVPNEFIQYRYRGREEVVDIKMTAQAHDFITIQTNKENLIGSDIFKSFTYYLDRRTSNKTEYITALIPRALQEKSIYEKFGFESLEASKPYISYYYNKGVVSGIKKNEQIQAIKNNHYLKLGTDLMQYQHDFVIQIPDRYERQVVDYKLGFVIDLYAMQSSSFLLPIAPMIGELDKHGMMTKNFKLLSDSAHFEPPVFNELEKELIYLSTLLKNHKSVIKNEVAGMDKEDINRLIPHAAAFHQLMSTFIDLNKNQYPIFAADLKQKLNKNKVRQLYFAHATNASAIVVHRNDMMIEIGFRYFVPPPNEEEQERYHTSFVEEMFFTNDNIHFYLPKTFGEMVIGKVFEDIDRKFHFSQSVLHTVVKNFLIPFAKLIAIDYDFVIPEEPSITVSRSVYIAEAGDYLIIKPVVNYDFGEVNILESAELLLTETNKLRRYQRNYEFEENFIQLLTTQHPDFTVDTTMDYFYIHFNEVIKNAWYIDFFKILTDNNIQVFGKEKVNKINVNAYKPITLLRTNSEIDWFQIKLKVTFNGQAVSLRDIRKAIVKKEQYILLKDGTMGLLPEEWVEKHVLLLSLGAVEHDEIRLSKIQFSALEPMLDDIAEDDIRREIKEKKKVFLDFDKMNETPLPAGIQATLRDYQLAGYNWLHFLHQHGWGGCLADDMGLGKTIQIITFLSSVLVADTPHLVVVPTTLLFNWEEELQRFAPHLRYLVWHSWRDRDTTLFTSFDIVLTTYGVVSSEIEELKKIPFNYIVLDESQAIKNPLSLRYRSVIQLKGINKLVMTGTPIENNIFDLYAQMNFVNPGLLGSLEIFKNQFVTKIERQESVSDHRLLKGLIKPFMLRRTKEQVLKELPSKTESILYCEMGAEQRQVYNTFKEKIQADLLEKMNESGMRNIGIYIIDGLLKLRQICDSPAILNAEADYGNASIKIEELMRNITQKTGKHKVLVFSQFVKMLQQVIPALETAGISYAYLDGQTANRSRVVNEFIHDDEKRVFLISLKSGGFGLNLTVADYVFLLDPWWNPAVENQAIDRVHRIGQQNKVFAYRMICKDTVEEKIMLIQEKKRQLSGEIISSESGFIKNLSKEDLLFLLN